MFVTVWCFWIRFVQRIWYIGLKLYLPKDLCICVCALQKRAQKYKRIQREKERDKKNYYTLPEVHYSIKECSSSLWIPKELAKNKNLRKF